MSCTAWCAQQLVGSESLRCINGWTDSPARTCGHSVSASRGCGAGASSSFALQVIKICRCAPPLGWVAPTAQPTVHPSTRPPSLAPTDTPTTVPSARPTTVPTVSPTLSPSSLPTAVPTAAPTMVPIARPTSAPDTAPTQTPTDPPTASPTTALSATGAPDVTQSGSSPTGLIVGATAAAVAVAIGVAALCWCSSRQSSHVQTDMMSTSTVAMVSNPMHHSAAAYEEPIPVPLDERVGNVALDKQRYVVLSVDPAMRSGPSHHVYGEAVPPINHQTTAATPQLRSPYAHPDTARAPSAAELQNESVT